MSVNYSEIVSINRIKEGLNNFCYERMLDGEVGCSFKIDISTEAFILNRKLIKKEKDSNKRL